MSKQGLAIALSVARKAKKKMAKGGRISQQDVDASNSDQAKNMAIAEAAKSNQGRMTQQDVDSAKAKLGYAKGGLVDRIKKYGDEKVLKEQESGSFARDGEQGVHQESYSKGDSYRGQSGMSEAGNAYRNSKYYDPKRKTYGHVMAEHKSKLDELKKMAKPKIEGLAHGGEVDEDMANMLSSDGIVKGVMKKKLMMAQGGQVPEELDYLKEDRSYPDPDGYELDMLDPDSDEMFPDVSMEPSEEAQMKKKKVLDMIFSNMGKDSKY